MSEMSEQGMWRKPPEDFVLSAEAVHLWRVELNQPSRVSGLMALLTPDEIVRMERYHHRRDRDGFAVTRGALRYMLGRYLGVAATDIEIEYGRHGKPYVENHCSGTSLQFNISHSGSLALMGFTLERPIGVDLEKIRAEVDLDGVAAVFLSPTEAADLGQRSGDDKIDAFYRYWVCKEAYLKVRGTGMTLSSRSFSMSIADAFPELVQAPPCDQTPKDWSFSWVNVAPDFRAAIVCGGALPKEYEFYDF